MRVLIVTTNFPPEIGGAASYAWELHQRLPPKIKTQVVTFAKNPDEHLDKSVFPGKKI
ncbi:hypothetical protein HY085_02985 [Candidatus Gottesmanbacteria bacterium]|nr:hypothetical protein [Candidatus Gottesmanbacteria bacterium]